MKKILILILYISFLLLVSNTNAKGKNIKQSFMPGEELIYEVSFMGIKLGSISIFSEEETTMNGRKIYKARSEMRSYSGIPFVDLDAVFESWMDASLTYSHLFKSKMKLSDGSWENQTSTFNYPENKIHFYSVRADTVYKNKNIETKRRLNDGCSLFFLARQYVDRGETVRVPTLLDDNIYTTVINFHGKPEKISINSINYPVDVLYFDGKAEWKGIYGLNGYFKGWFSNDEASVPIRATMNVYVGNVNIELIKWKRDGWTPPRAK